MRLAGFTGGVLAAIGIGASILSSSMPTTSTPIYADLIHAATGVFSACALFLLQRQLGYLGGQAAWGRGWEMARAGCWALAGAGALAALRPLVTVDATPALAAGGLVLTAGVGVVALDLRRLGGSHG